MKVVFFHRKPRPNYNFSVENLFKQIREALPSGVLWEIKELSFYSEGVFKRLLVGLEAAFSQKGINHVTGDINFIAIFLRKKRTVLTILDVGFMNHPSRLARLILRWFWIILPVRNSRVITTISSSTKNEVLKYVRIDPDRIKVIYVPILSLFKSSPREFNKDCPVILQIGTKFNKNVMRLVEALHGISCVLEIVGEIDNELKEQLSRWKVNYKAYKNLSNNEIVKRYEAADIVAFASTYEGFGMPIVEANAVGRVVVTSNVLSMPEVAGNAAHLVDPFSTKSIREGILKVINDDQYRDQLVSNGYQNCKRFEAAFIASQYAEVYRQLG